MSGPVPSLLWAHVEGHAHVTVVDAIADELQEVERELGIDPPPVDWVQSEPEELAAKLGDRRFDLVFTRHTLHKVENLQAVFEGVSRVLEPGGLFCLEAVADEGERAAWNFPVRFSLRVQNGRLEARDHLDRPALDLERAGLELVSISPEQPNSRPGDLLHVCLRRKR
jgi:SAM-dependent methyltransferase